MTTLGEVSSSDPDNHAEKARRTQEQLSIIVQSVRDFAKEMAEGHLMLIDEGQIYSKTESVVFWITAHTDQEVKNLVSALILLTSKTFTAFTVSYRTQRYLDRGIRSGNVEDVIDGFVHEVAEVFNKNDAAKKMFKNLAKARILQELAAH